MLHEWQSQPATSTDCMFHFHFNTLTLKNKMISRKKRFGNISVGEIHRILYEGEFYKVEIIAFGNLKCSSNGLVENPLLIARQLGDNHDKCFNYRRVRWLDFILKDQPFCTSEEWLSNNHNITFDEYIEH
jgi:hypothetical protein